MKILQSFWTAVMPALRRFPAAFFLIFCSVVFISILILKNDSLYSANELSALSKATYWGTALALFASLLCEAFKVESEKKRRLISVIVQAAVMVFCLTLWYQFCTVSTHRRTLIYVCTFLAFAALAVYLLKRTQKERHIVPNIFVSSVIAGIVAFVVWSGLIVLALAVKFLLYDYGDPFNYVLPITAVISYGLFYHYFLIAYASKPEERIALPKAFLKVLMLYILFPLYALLILLLYAYLIKSVVTLSLPQGEINWFVSFATAFYLIFYFMLGSYKNPAVNFFYKYGSLFLFLLIIVQCIAFGIRIYHYGYTGARYASLLYIIFSFVFCSMTLFKGGKYMSLVFPLFAGILLLASVTPLNLLDMPVRSQSSRIFAVLRKYDLCGENGVTLKDESALDRISEEDRVLISSAFSIIRGNENKPQWLEKCEAELPQEQFDKLFGSSKAYEEAYSMHFFFSVDDSARFNISSFNEMYVISGGRVLSNRLTIELDVKGQEALDITDEVKALLPQNADSKTTDFVYENRPEPLIIKKDGCTVFITRLNIFFERKKEGVSISHLIELRGFVMR